MSSFRALTCSHLTKRTKQVIHVTFELLTLKLIHEIQSFN